MTRKRFVKLLMSQNFDRSTVNYVANRLIDVYGSYNECWTVANNNVPKLLELFSD